jgi:hypothetical protein
LVLGSAVAGSIMVKMVIEHCSYSTHHPARNVIISSKAIIQILWNALLR